MFSENKWWWSSSRVVWVGGWGGIHSCPKGYVGEGGFTVAQRVWGGGHSCPEGYVGEGGFTVAQRVMWGEGGGGFTVAQRVMWGEGGFTVAWKVMLGFTVAQRVMWGRGDSQLPERLCWGSQLPKGLCGGGGIHSCPKGYVGGGGGFTVAQRVGWAKVPVYISSLESASRCKSRVGCIHVDFARRLFYQIGVVNMLPCLADCGEGLSWAECEHGRMSWPLLLLLKGMSKL